jgi:protein-tyrosine phosphatase
MNPDTASLSRAPPPITNQELEDRLIIIRQQVAQPYTRGFADPQPAILTGGVLIGSKYHAADVSNLKALGVTAVLNCASGGISRLPVDLLEEEGIHYRSTNVRCDDYDYPILHNAKTWQVSAHLQVARKLYQEQVVDKKGKILFFCVAGMNRSTCLGIAALLLYGYDLQPAISECAQQRSFVLENQGFQQQLLELQAFLTVSPKSIVGKFTVYDYGAPPLPGKLVLARTQSMLAREAELVEIELLIPGLCTMDVKVPIWSTIDTVKQCLIDHANRHLLTYDTTNNATATSTNATRRTIAKSWLVLAMFGYDSMYDVPLEIEAIDFQVQLERIQNMFRLGVRKILTPGGASSYLVNWTHKCRFALVIFSIYADPIAIEKNKNIVVELEDPTSTTPSTVTPTKRRLQQPWTFLHEERPGAPATFLENTNLLTTNLRAWDFVTGQAYASEQPIVFSYSNDEKNRRSFMKISTSANRALQFHAPGEGGILGMGANAIVHRVLLKPTSLASSTKGDPTNDKDSLNDNAPRTRSLVRADSQEDDDEELSHQVGWDAAVKRPFSLSKMLASLQNSSEAGLAKRMRFANSLNSDGRVLYFYGLGVAMSANMTTTLTNRQEQEAAATTTSRNSKHEYKWEAILLARYEEEFSTYTMKRFMDDYTAIVDHVRQKDPTRVDAIIQLQHNFSLYSVKILLVSLLNAFRDLTLMGVQAFDFNHLSNVLVSRDHRQVRLIDIDGNSKGSIQFPSEYIQGDAEDPSSISSTHPSTAPVHKPALDIDLNAVLPTVIIQLLLGKGRGVAFVTNTKSEIWRAPPDKAKAQIRQLLMENFYPNYESSSTTMMMNAKVEKHLSKLTEWFYATLKKEAPWMNWTKDIYDAMRCIDHLPIA